MKHLKWLFLLTLVIGSTAFGADYLRKAGIDNWYPVVLVDAVDGYSPETEKKYGDTTVTYCNISDGNTPIAYTDAAVDFNEVGNGTGEYRLRIGAAEFTTADKDYLVKLAVTGCRTVRFIVHTTVGAIGNIATTDDGGAINVDSGLAQAVLKSWDGNDLTAASWNATTHMANVDVNYVQEDDPLSAGGYSDLSQIIRMQLEATVDADPNAGSIAKLTKDYLTGDAYARLGAPVGASVSADIAALSTKVTDVNDSVAALATDVNEVGEDVWLNPARTLTALDEDDTTIDLNGTTVNASATVDAAAIASIVDGVFDELIAEHEILGTFGWVLKVLMGLL